MSKIAPLLRRAGPTATFATATPVSVAGGADTGGTNIALPPGRSISGTIRNAGTGTALAGALVDVFDAATGALVVGAFKGSGTTLVTGASGFYTTATILPKGSYKVRARSPGFLDRFFNARADLATADPIDVTTGNISNRDVALPPLPPRLSLRDDFDLPEIDASLWGGTLEIRRRVLDNGGSHVFESQLRQFGTSGENSLLFVNPDSVNSVEAKIAVTAVDVAGAQPYARIIGAFYNDGVTAVTPDGRKGDVYAEIAIRRRGLVLELPDAVVSKEAAAHNGRYHRVKPKETVYSIARRYRTSADELYRLNNLDKTKNIKPGQKLLVAP